MLPRSPQNRPDVQIPDSREKCPKCGSVLKNVYAGVSSFAGHLIARPSFIVGYECPKCVRYFSNKEFLRLKEKKMRREVFARNYWKNVRTVLLNPYLYIVVVGFMLLGRSFWAGIIVGAAVVLLAPFLEKGLEIVFAPIGKLVRKILPTNKPPDNPRTP